MSKKDKDNPIESADRDAIDSLPLSSIPLSSNALKNAKLIKNSRMETTVELHSDPVSGSLQVSPETIGDYMEASPQDRAIIKNLAGLHSFDVYSLRTNLKKMGVEVEDEEALILSDDMKEQLSVYSLEFIRPLVEKIFGQGREELNNIDGLQKIFRDPDIARVRENLRVMSGKTNIPLADIPAFLEEYSEIFLSVAYYRYSFEKIGPDVDRFMGWIRELRTHRDVMSSPMTASQCKTVDETVRFIAASIRERLAQFRSSFELFWVDINSDSFRQMRQQIEQNHSTMGAVLCGLVVKMNHWKREFPDNARGGPAARMKFVVTEMEPGLQKLKDLEQEARNRLGMVHGKN